MAVSNYQFSDVETARFHHYRDNQDDARLKARFIAILMLATTISRINLLRCKDKSCRRKSCSDIGPLPQQLQLKKNSVLFDSSFHFSPPALQSRPNQQLSGGLVLLLIKQSLYLRVINSDCAFRFLADELERIIAWNNSKGAHGCNGAVLQVVFCATLCTLSTIYICDRVSRFN